MMIQWMIRERMVAETFNDKPTGACFCTPAAIRNPVDLDTGKFTQAMKIIGYCFVFYRNNKFINVYKGNVLCIIRQSRYIIVDSAAFDTMVQVMSVDGRDSEPPAALGQDDDNGVGLNSLLVFEAGEAGNYIIRVTSFGQGSAGAYRLWVSQ
jgi:hypothetical protein